MAAIIRPIERKSVHQIQSGQVIGDGLTSVVKELVENALDAHSTSIEVRFKNHGLDAIEVIDNGSGISADNYESICLKHWTSKLTTYDDLDSVTTFGFRGEALSSLCALSDLQITTATAGEAPKGTRLEFETSGKLKSRSVAAAQRGTTVLVENIFKTLPVRRKELERNVKRDYTKVLGVLQAYAGVCIGVKFSVFNQPSKGKRTPVFATKGNKTTRENIANVFGAKTLSALVALDLKFEMKSTRTVGRVAESKEIKIVGHISRPIVGEGRQAPDRQMFFVNGRPCVLPQISRAFNEVYKTFNITQSPFIFADLQMDTNAYDVNVSPDKRSILLHDQAELLENLKTSLISMFTNHEQTVPHSQIGTANVKLPSYKQLTLERGTTGPSSSSLPSKPPTNDTSLADPAPEEDPPEPLPAPPTKPQNTPLYTFPAPPRASFKPPTTANPTPFASTTTADEITISDSDDEPTLPPPPISSSQLEPELPRSSMTSPLSKLSYRSPRRAMGGRATITIGDREPVVSGESPQGSPSKRRKVMRGKVGKVGVGKLKFGGLERFVAPGARVEETEGASDVEVEEEEVEVEEEEEEVDYGGGQFETWEGEEMELDKEDVADEDLEVFREASQAEMADGEGVVEVVAKPIVEERENPLFLPNAELDAMLSGDEGSVHEEVVAEAEAQEEEGGVEVVEEEKEGEGEIEEEEPFNPQEQEDGDFTDPYENLNQSSLRAQKRAEKLLIEAEAIAAAAPASKSLERAFQILSGSRTHSTKNTIRTYNTSISAIRQASKTLLLPPTTTTSSSLSPTSTLTEDDTTAEERLNLTITKQDFFTMQIKGQFNRGFILATRADDLFIIDQHASDEKYNFETLQRDTIMQHQRLVVPKTLDLMAMDEVIITEHLSIFRKNGFVIEVDPDAPTGARCRLVTLPLSGSTVFGIKDLEELVHLVHESAGNDPAVRCSKVRSMFAMRACKKSTKVGRALTLKGMERIVRHMGELEKPWNCPHGRPTMRHLMELGRVEGWSEEGELGGLKWDSDSWADVQSWMEGGCGEEGEEGYEEEGGEA